MVRHVKATTASFGSDWIPKPGRRVASRVIDGRALLLDPAEDRVHMLNEVGTFIWSLVNERRHTVRDLAGAIAAEFDVDDATATADLHEFLDGLLAQGFIDG